MTSLLASLHRQAPYITMWQQQEQLRERMIQQQADPHIFIVEHTPVITLGRGAKDEQVYKAKDWLTNQGIDVVETNRGGQATYHGPGQLVCYPVIDLRTFRWGVKSYVAALEDLMISTLALSGLAGADRRLGYPGVWCQGRKIGSIGVHVRRQISIHGLALNINPNMLHFSYIQPCGISDVVMTSLAAELGTALTVEAVINNFVNSLANIFSCDIELAKG